MRMTGGGEEASWVDGYKKESRGREEGLIALLKPPYTARREVVWKKWAPATGEEEEAR